MRVAFRLAPGYNKGMSNDVLRDDALLNGVLPGASRFRTFFLTAEAVLAFLGAGIAGTLWWADRTRQDVPCSAGGGCAVVAASAWSHVDLIAVHQVPVALLGLIGYVLLLTLAMLRLGSDNAPLDHRLHQAIWLISGGGVLYSWYLQWVAHTEIGAFCLWCRSSAIVMTLLFGAATWEGLAARQRSVRGRKTHD